MPSVSSTALGLTPVAATTPSVNELPLSDVIIVAVLAIDDAAKELEFNVIVALSTVSPAVLATVDEMMGSVIVADAAMFKSSDGASLNC